jgi:hypothetical protein
MRRGCQDHPRAIPGSHRVSDLVCRVQVPSRWLMYPLTVLIADCAAEMAAAAPGVPGSAALLSADWSTYTVVMSPRPRDVVRQLPRRCFLCRGLDLPVHREQGRSRLRSGRPGRVLVGSNPTPYAQPAKTNPDLGGHADQHDGLTNDVAAVSWTIESGKTAVRCAGPV